MIKPRKFINYHNFLKLFFFVNKINLLINIHYDTK